MTIRIIDATPWWEDDDTYHFAVFNDSNGKFEEFGGSQTWTIEEWKNEYPEIPEGFKQRVIRLLPGNETPLDAGEGE